MLDFETCFEVLSLECVRADRMRGADGKALSVYATNDPVKVPVSNKIDDVQVKDLMLKT